MKWRTVLLWHFGEMAVACLVCSLYLMVTPQPSDTFLWYLAGGIVFPSAIYRHFVVGRRR